MKIDTCLHKSLMNLANANTESVAGNLRSFSEALKGKVEEGAGHRDPYDFTNVTAKQLHEKVGSLIQSGQMDLGDSSSLLGFMGGSPLDMVNYDGTSPGLGAAPFNAFTRIQEAIAGVLSRNEKESAESLQKAYNALAQLQGQSANSGG